MVLDKKIAHKLLRNTKAPRCGADPRTDHSKEGGGYAATRERSSTALAERVVLTSARFCDPTAAGVTTLLTGVILVDRGLEDSLLAVMVIRA